ncbi:MAG: hypothetical protein JWN43_3171, partial [Gammaproteobacteria bacterium]|nr:hypothetical protein [Gammaproteobacteria bacterium]
MESEPGSERAKEFSLSIEQRLANPIAIHIGCLGFGKKAVGFLRLVDVVRNQLGKLVYT